MYKKRSIVWFRNDLRLHDNESVTEALRYSEEIIYLYVFDPRMFGTSKYGFPKTGRFRTKFLLESVRALKEAIEHRNGKIIIRVGFPEEIIPELASRFKTNGIFCNRERTSEEELIQNSLEKTLWSIGQEMRYFRGKMLIYTSDLPFPINQTPDIFTQFRKEVEHMVPIREPLPAPSDLKSFNNPSFDYGNIPDSTELIDLELTDNHPNTSFPLKGGEHEGLKRLEDYIWNSGSLATYKDTRNGLNGLNYSSKFSPYLANGSLSPKMIYHQILKFEEQSVSNESTYWMKFELLWRDFFRFMAKKHGNSIFKHCGTSGIKDKPKPEFDPVKFQKWIDGQTGVPFIDANMRELKYTGYMSNRGRQNVASYLINELEQPWLAGAEYFESILIDYDPASNYGNWNYLAGVGSDPRQDRHFNIVNQAKKYDPNGDYVRLWCPELKDLSAEELYNLWHPVAQ
jgi:deoxyribodipyrimidine photo-lyase